MPKRVLVAYGPPGQKGVQAIMGLGADDVEPHPSDDMLKKATWIGIAIWAIGVVVNKPTLRGLGLGAASVGLGVRYLGEKNLAAPAPTPTTTVPPGAMIK